MLGYVRLGVLYMEITHTVRLGFVRLGYVGLC